MITSENYMTTEDSYKSRLISPIYKPEKDEYCLSFYYNINTIKNKDGFRILFQNYLEANDIQVKKIEGMPLNEENDKWFYEETQLTNLSSSNFYIVMTFI